jgi:hypothetical protein
MRFPLQPPKIAVFVFAIFASLAANSARAFNDPVDIAGPLTVRIVGPATVSAVETPQTIEVKLENGADTPLAGTLELGLIDPWRAEPTKPVAFSIAAKGKAQVAFQVTAGAGTYSALYPIHAWARFPWQGREETAHPVLILDAKLPAAPRVKAALPWKALEVPPGGSLALWQVPVFRTIVAVFNQPPLTLPIAWQGVEPRTRAVCSVHPETLAGDRRETVNMHPPYFDKHVGTILTEYPLQLPNIKPLRLEFANAVTPEGKGDGVTFRVRVAAWDAPEGTLGQIAWEKHIAAKQWQPAQADLDRWAGQTIRLQLESHPGPQNDTGWDSSFWAQPTLVAGVPAAASSNPSQPIPLGTIRCGGAEYAVVLQPGQRGLLDSTIVFLVSGHERLNFQGFQVRVLGSQLDDPRSPIRLRETKTESVANGCRVRHRFEGFSESFDLLGHLRVEDNMLKVSFQLENQPPPQPWRVVRLESVAAGSWSQAAGLVYAGVGNVIRDPQTFQLPFDGHRLATSFVGFDFPEGLSVVQASDLPPEMLDVRPQQRHYSLHVPEAATLSFIPAPNVWEGVKVWRAGNGLKAAGGVSRAAGRFVFDLWGGRYAESAAQLQKAFQYGLTDSMVVWHNWQRWGYDYRLPEICPPAPQLGTLAEMQELIRTCKQVDVPFAPHDNYIDFYPDAAGFSYDKQIAFRAPGEPVKAWLNEWRKAQSYRYRADRIEPFLQANVQWIKQNLAPTAYFIDVWSSASPYDYWTADGQFFSRITTLDAWRRHFAWIRDTLGGNAPQISESGHDQLIGWLDGAQTNHLRVGKALPGKKSWTVWNIDCADAERTPWLDAAHHDRFVLHGAGYPSRYEGGLNPREHGIYSDDYMATEALTGHPAMVSHTFNRDVVRKYWLLHGLGQALALRTIEQVEFVHGDLHRQHIQWSGGGQVWVNRGREDWSVEGQVLPEFGFLARIPTPQGMLEAAIARQEGLICESARGPDELYVNGRAGGQGGLSERLQVKDVRRLGPRHYELSLTCQADQPIPSEWRPFLHFVDTQGNILFQAHLKAAAISSPATGSFTARAEFSIPEQYQAGESFELRYGLYRSASGERMQLAGPDDGTRRIRLGSIRLGDCPNFRASENGTVPFTDFGSDLDRFPCRGRFVPGPAKLRRKTARLRRPGHGRRLPPESAGANAVDYAFAPAGRHAAGRPAALGSSALEAPRTEKCGTFGPHRPGARQRSAAARCRWIADDRHPGRRVRLAGAGGRESLNRQYPNGRRRNRHMNMAGLVRWAFPTRV